MQARCRIEEENQGKCIGQFVQSVERNVRSPSNLTDADQFTAESAILNEGDIKLKS